MQDVNNKTILVSLPIAEVSAVTASPRGVPELFKPSRSFWGSVNCLVKYSTCAALDDSHDNLHLHNIIEQCSKAGNKVFRNNEDSLWTT